MVVRDHLDRVRRCGTVAELRFGPGFRWRGPQIGRALTEQETGAGPSAERLSGSRNGARLGSPSAGGPKSRTGGPCTAARLQTIPVLTPASRRSADPIQEATTLPIGCRPPLAIRRGYKLTQVRPVVGHELEKQNKNQNLI